VNGLLVVFVLCGTATSSVALGVYGAYLLVNGLLAACNPSRPAPVISALLPHQSQIGGD
jgi:hypothetical protein